LTIRRVGAAQIAIGLLLLAVLGVALDRDHLSGSVRDRGSRLNQLAAASGGRFADPITVARVWPGAPIIMDTQCRPFDLLRYRALARPRSLAQVALPDVPTIDAGVRRSGRWRNHSWSLNLQRRSSTRENAALLVWCERNTYTIVQSGFLPSFDAQEFIEAPDDPWVGHLSGASRRLWTDVAVDTSVLIGLMLFGGLFLPGGGGAARPGLALLVGMSAWGLLGILLVSTSMMLALSVIVAYALSRSAQWDLSGRTVLGWTRADVPAMVGFAIVILAVAVRARNGNLLLLHTDSMSFLLGGWAYAAGSMDAALLDAKRGLVLQALHGPGFLLRAEGLQSLATASYAAGAWVLITALAARLQRNPGISVALIAAGALLLFSPFLVRSSALVNTHLLIAGLLLSLVILWERGAGSAEDAGLGRPVLAASVLASAVVLLRPEGALVIALLLIGTLWSDARWRIWTPVWQAAGLASIAWGVLLMLGALQRGVPLGLDRWSAVPIGIMLFFAPLALRKLPGSAVPWLPTVMLSGLWMGALAVVAVRGGKVRFFTAARENVFLGRGGWGVLWVTLLMLVLVGLGRTLGSDRAKTLGPALALLIGFAPLTMFVKMLDNVRSFDLDRMLSGGGRVGYFDSVNRMWMHVLLVALYFGVSQTLVGPARPAGRTARRVQAGTTVRAVSIAVIALSVARLWAPGYVEVAPLRGDVDSGLISVVTVQGTIVVGELVDGAVIEQQFLLDDRIGEDPEARIVRVCVDVPLVTFARTNSGEVRITLAHGTRSATESFRSADLEDWGSVRSCLALPTGPEPALPFRIIVTGHGGRPDGSPSLLRTTGALIGDGAVVLPATFSEGDGNVPMTLAGPIGFESSVSTTKGSWLSGIPHLRSRALLILPSGMALLVVALMAADALWLRRSGRPLARSNHPDESTSMA
jgi:hypothetical protein